MHVLNRGPDKYGEFNAKWTLYSHKKFSGKFDNVSRYYLDNAHLSSIIIQLIWGMLDDFQFMTMNTLVAMSYPGVAQMIQILLLNLIQFDILYTEDWLPLFFEKI